MPREFSYNWLKVTFQTVTPPTTFRRNSEISGTRQFVETVNLPQEACSQCITNMRESLWDWREACILRTC